MKLKNKILSAFLLVCLLVTAMPTAFVAGENVSKTFTAVFHSSKDAVGSEVALEGVKGSIQLADARLSGTWVTIAEATETGTNSCAIEHNGTNFIFDGVEYPYLRTLVTTVPEGYTGNSYTSWTVEEFCGLTEVDGVVTANVSVRKEPVWTYETLLDEETVKVGRSYKDGVYQYTDIFTYASEDVSADLMKGINCLGEVDKNVCVTANVTGAGFPTVSAEVMASIVECDASFNIYNMDTEEEVSWYPVECSSAFELKQAVNTSVTTALDSAKIPYILLSTSGFNGAENFEAYIMPEYGILADGEYDEGEELYIGSKYVYYYDATNKVFTLCEIEVPYVSYVDEEYPEDNFAYTYFTGEPFPTAGYYVVVDEKLPESFTTVPTQPEIQPGEPENTLATVEAAWISGKTGCSWVVDIKPLAESVAKDVRYICEIYNEGNFVDSMGSEVYADGVRCDLSMIIAHYGSGNYALKVKAYDKATNELVGEGEVPAAKYVDPGKTLATPEITFSEDGVITFNLVDGADYYELIVIYQSVVNGDGGYDNGYILYPSDSKDGKTISFDYSEVYADVDDWDANFVACVKAYSSDINVAKSGEWSEDSNVWELRMSKDKAEEKLEAALKSEDPEEVKGALESIANETVIEIMKEDITEIKKAEEAWAEEKGIKVETKSEVETVDASKISIVGAAFNANGIDEKEVVLSVKEPEKKVEVDTKYSNAVALDIELFVAGVARENLTVPVAITMPIPEGVEKENLVILHYHGDAEEPVVIVPTVNEDGTMTFYVDGFSTFVIANQVVEATAPKTGDASGTAFVCSLLLLAAGVVLVMKRNSFAR